MYHAKPEIEVKLLLNLFLVTTFCQRRWGEDKLHGEQLERKTREKFIICANQSSYAYYSANHIIPFFSTCSVFQRSALPKPFPQLSLPWCSFLLLLCWLLWVLHGDMCEPNSWEHFQCQQTMKNKISAMGMAVALWIRRWTPEREREFWVQDPVETLFIQACLKSRVCFLHQPGHICC